MHVMWVSLTSANFYQHPILYRLRPEKGSFYTFAHLLPNLH